MALSRVEADGFALNYLPRENNNNYISIALKLQNYSKVLYGIVKKLY